MSYPTHSKLTDSSGDEEGLLQVADVDGHQPSDLPNGPDHVYVADRIRCLLVDHCDSARQIGEELLALKAEMKLTGEKRAFGEWMDRHFGWSQRQGQRFMKVAEFCRKYPDADRLPPSVIYLLAANTTPTEVLAAVMVEKQLGAQPTRRAVEKLIESSKVPNIFAVGAMANAPATGLTRAQLASAVAEDAADLILSQIKDRRALREQLGLIDGGALMRALLNQFDDYLGEDVASAA